MRYRIDRSAVTGNEAPLAAAARWSRVTACLCLLVVAWSRPSLAQGSGAPGTQAVVETSRGTFVLDLLPDTAPNTVALFLKTVASGGYNGTAFHRVVRNGMVQGGDPLTRDPSKRTLYGTGGLQLLKAEARAATVRRGAVASVLVPGKPDSAGTQFFVLLADQPALAGQYTVFATVADGMEVLQQIAATPVDADGLATERVEILRVSIRDTPKEPFVDESPTQLAAHRLQLETSEGPITIEVWPDRAPETVRQVLRMTAAGIYDGMSFHRVAPGFVIQTGALATRTVPLTERQQSLIHDLPPEFSETRHVKGVVSMARAESLTSAQTSFFICTGTSSALDGVYTAFGRVVEGMDVVERIEAAPRTGEAPNTRIDLRRARVLTPAAP